MLSPPLTSWAWPLYGGHGHYKTCMRLERDLRCGMNFEDTLAVRLRSAYLHLHRSANRHFRQFEATADQYAVLTCLAELDGSVRQQDIVRMLASDKRTVGKMVTLLEEKGLVERNPHPKDNRAWALTLTGEGRRQQKLLFDSAEYLRRRLEEAVPPEHLQIVRNALSSIAERLDPEEMTDVILSQKHQKTRK